MSKKLKIMRELKKLDVPKLERLELGNQIKNSNFNQENIDNIFEKIDSKNNYIEILIADYNLNQEIEEELKILDKKEEIHGRKQKKSKKL